MEEFSVFSLTDSHQLGMLTTKTLEGMRTEENFKLFYESVNQKSQSKNWSGSSIFYHAASHYPITPEELKLLKIISRQLERSFWPPEDLNLAAFDHVTETI